MARLTLALLLLGTLALASCAGSQKGPQDPVAGELEALRLGQVSLNTRLARVEGRLTQVEAGQQDLHHRLATLEPSTPPAQPEAAPEATQPQPEPSPQPPAPESAAATPAPAEPEAAYTAALALLREQGQPEEAKALFERFLSEHPGHALAPNARYWAAECLYDRKDFAAAVLAFKEVAAGHPAHPKAAAALLKMGLSYLNLKDEANARDYLGRVERLYPGTHEAGLAQAYLARLDASKEGKQP